MIKYFALIFFLFTSMQVHSVIKLPTLKTKINTKNLRYITSDGKITYYQRSGKLYLSTNYEALVLLENSNDAHYTVTSSMDGKTIIVSEDTNYHTFLGIRKEKQLYWSKIGDKKLTKIGRGILPKLHLGGSWVSFYKPLIRVIRFKNVGIDSNFFDISMANNKNPYFFPQIEMLSDVNVLFTDLNKEAVPGIIRFDKNKKTSSLLYKARDHNSRLEICLTDSKLYIGEFGINSSNNGSQIFETSRSNPNTNQRNLKSLYKSRLNDLGKMDCAISKNKIFFIKKTLSFPVENFEAFYMMKKTQKLTQLSELKYVYHIIRQDQSLFIPMGGEYHIIRGKDDFTGVDVLEN